LAYAEAVGGLSARVLLRVYRPCVDWMAQTTMGSKGTYETHSVRGAAGTH